jgi:phosphoadenosine phosphosulfate reductase
MSLIYNLLKKILKHIDPTGELWAIDPDRCCDIRKVLPMNGVLEKYDVVITGRKRYQGASRSQIGFVDKEDKNSKLNPLAFWTQEDVCGYMVRHDLPQHPLLKKGFLSIGCHPCTERVSRGEDSRSGRWKNQIKTECEINNRRK